MTSFFGGDPNVAHFAVSTRFRINRDEGTIEARQRQRAEQAILKEAGIKPTTYFQFKVNDTIGKERAKRYAEKEAAKIEAQTGVKMNVYEGCFL